MAVHQHRETSPGKVSIGIVTVSDSRTKETDSSGELIEKLAREKGHSVLARKIVMDDAGQILAALKESIETGADVVLFTGGTGITSRDITYETLRPLMDKVMDGFGELFRQLSHAEIGTAAIMSRSFAGIISRRVVFCLPGSPDACRLAVEKIILPEIGHIVREVKR